MEMTRIEDVPLLQIGTFRLRSGVATFTSDDLDAVVAAQEDPAVRPPKIGPGHDSAHDGTPALGVVESMRRIGDKVVGTMLVPSKLAEIIRIAWPNRSIEGRRDVVTSSGKRHRMVVDRLALLGVTSPGVDSLDDIHAVMAAERRAESSFVIAAGERMTETDQEASPMDIRAKLGLPADASDEDVVAKLDALLEGNAADQAPIEADGGEAETETEPVTDETPADLDPSPVAEALPEPVAASGPEVVTITAERWQQVEAELATARDEREQRERDRRDEVIASAQREGRIGQAEAADWRRRLDEAPEVTAEIIASLAPTGPAGGELGYSGVPSGHGAPADPFAGTGSTTAQFGAPEFPGRDRLTLVASADEADPFALPDDGGFSDSERARIKAARDALRG